MEQIMKSWRILLDETKRKELVVDIEVDEEEDDDFKEGDEVEIEVVEDEEEMVEWKEEDDDSYPSRKKRSRDSKAMKPDRGSWSAGYDALKSLGRGKVGLDAVSLEEKKKERKKWCHQHSPWHGLNGRFVNPEKERGSASMKKPDADSPDDCRWGQQRRVKANRSTQATQRDCGRGAKYRCYDGSAKYQEALNLLEDMLLQDELIEGQDEQLEAYLSGVISRELERAIKKHMSSNGCSFAQLVRAMNLWSQSEKGDIGKVEK